MILSLRINPPLYSYCSWFALISVMRSAVLTTLLQLMTMPMIPISTYEPIKAQIYLFFFLIMSIHELKGMQAFF